MKVGLAVDGPTGIDKVRRKYLSQMSEITGRNTILYVTRWTSPVEGMNPYIIMVNMEDIHGLMEAIHGLDCSKGLDLILHSSGGSPTAAEAMVKYLRAKFTDIRVIIPQAAMSAATMLACSSDKIVMSKHSYLGPIDPQFTIMTPLGPKMVPAVAVLEQFKQIQEECKDPQKLAVWLPMLGQYGPSLLVECKNAIALSTTLVSQWLGDYMFMDEADKAIKAASIAATLSNHSLMLNHGRPIDYQTARGFGLKVDILEDDPALQEAVLSVFHASMNTFNFTPAAKIIENNLGKAFVKTVHINQGILVQQPKSMDPVESQGTPPDIV